MIDKMKNWTASYGRLPGQGGQPGGGRTHSYGDYISGHIGAGGGEGVKWEGVRYKNGALRVTFHYHSAG